MATFDFHMHTDSSPDGHFSALQMCESAIEKGLTQIAITDHCDFPDWITDDYANRVERSWREQTNALSAVEGRLSLSRGIEIGSPLLDPALTDKVLNAHPYDFILASLHQLGRHPDFYYLNYSEIDILKTLDQYFDGLLDIVNWGRFSSLSHLTYPFRYIPDGLSPKDYSRWDDQIDAIFKGLIEKGLSMEINTSGIRKRIGIPSPDLPLIKRYRKCGGEMITIGSDAHYAEDVAANIDDVLELARSVGFRYVAVYKDLKPTMLPI